MNDTDAARRPILIVDDEPGVLRAVSTALTGAGFRILITVEDSRDVMKIMADNKVGVVILDLRMPHVSGQELLAEIRRLYPRVPVIILTANDDIESAVECMKLGAYDYQVKPIDNTKLIRTVRNAQEMHELRHELRTLRHHMILHDLENEEAFSEIVTVSGHMYGIFRYCEAIAKSGEPILITGEPGTGRSLLARVIHDSSGREGNAVVVDVGGMDEERFAREVFGSESLGGEDGSVRSETPGAISRCANGTLIVRNIQNLHEESQRRLLRLLEDKTYIPSGAGMARRASVRVIAIAGPELANSIQEGRFRRDLSAKLQDHHVEMPALRERREDIPFLLNHFAEYGAARQGVEKPPVPAELISRLMAYTFPGNIPELETLVNNSIINYAKGISLMDTFTEQLGDRLPAAAGVQDNPGSAEALVRVFGHFPTVDEAVDHLIDSALKVTDGNKKAAADILQITRQTINRRLRMKR